MHTEKVQEVTLEKGGWSSLTSDVRTRSRIKPPNFAREVYKILVKSSECDSKIYSLSSVGDSDDGTAWKVCDSFTSVFKLVEQGKMNKSQASTITSLLHYE